MYCFLDVGEAAGVERTENKEIKMKLFSRFFLSLVLFENGYCQRCKTPGLLFIIFSPL